MSLSIIIPVYNEEAIIKETAERLSAFCDERDEECEIIFSDDGSRDGSADIIRSLAEKNSRIKLVCSEENRGKGHAVKLGMLASKFDTALFTDSDLAYGTEQMEAIIEEHRKSGNSVTVGSRSRHKDGYHGYSPLRKLMSKTYFFIVKLYSGCKVSDSQTGLKCFRGDAARDIFADVQTDGFAFDLDVLLTAAKKGYGIGDFPVYIKEQGERKSKVDPVSDTLKMIRDIRKIKKRVKGR